MARIVIALGGNALQRDGRASAADQQAVARETAAKLAILVSQGNQLIIVHGNGPQVGNIVLNEQATSTSKAPAMPLDSCVAMSQGSIGYWLQQALTDELHKIGIHSQAVSIVTQSVVDADDPNFQNPEKPIGPFYASEDEARASSKDGHVFREDSGRGWRRVVASPVPIAIVETDAITALVDSGVPLIVGGGGGIPVIKQSDGTHKGVEAVIDKDFCAALIADRIKADRFIILTSVPAVMTGYGTPEQKSLALVSYEQLQQHIADNQFGAGSMLPKIKAVQQFVKQSGKPAVIGELEEIEAVVAGQAGTTITP